MYTTRFPHVAKRMQRKRQMVFKSVDGGRIHEQTLDLELFCSLAVDVASEFYTGPKTNGDGF